MKGVGLTWRTVVCCLPLLMLGSLAGARDGLQRLVASDFAIDAYFGAALALQDNVMVVGAPGEATMGSEAGAAYVFRRNRQTGEWQQEAKLLADDGAEGDAFGSAVAVARRFIFVGAPGSDGHSRDHGAVYVYRKKGRRWVQSGVLRPEGERLKDGLFGASVAAAGRVAVVGAPGTAIETGCGRDLPGPACEEGQETVFAKKEGAAYAFQRTAKRWKAKGRLPDSRDTRGSSARFGTSVATDGKRIAVGAPLRSVRVPPELPGYTSFESPGAVHVFGRQGPRWREQSRLVPWELYRDISGPRFGTDVDFHGDLLVGTAPAAGLRGAGYLFQLTDGEWVEEYELASPKRRVGFGEKGTLAVASDVIYVGSPHWNSGGRYGRVSVFRWKGKRWVAAAPLEPERLKLGDLGASVVASDQEVVFSAPDESEVVTEGGEKKYFFNAGAVYVRR